MIANCSFIFCQDTFNNIASFLNLNSMLNFSLACGRNFLSASRLQLWRRLELTRSLKSKLIEIDEHLGTTLQAHFKSCCGDFKTAVLRVQQQNDLTNLIKNYVQGNNFQNSVVFRTWWLCYNLFCLLKHC